MSPKRIGAHTFQLAVFSLALSATGRAQPLSFTPLSKTVVWEGPSNAIPAWSRGGFITLDQPAASMTAASTSSPDSMVYIFAGGVSTTLAVKIPGAVFTQNMGIARDNDGTIAVCGTAKDATGRAFPYLAIFAPGAQEPIVIRTEPYVPAAVTILGDGTIWTKGADSVTRADGTWVPNKKSANGILRHFSRTGSALGSALPQSGFANMGEIVRQGLLASSADRVGWCQYMGYGAGTQPSGGSYFEVTADGAVSKTPLPPFNEGEEILAVAITDSGRVLLTKTLHNNNAQLFSLDRALGIWQKVQFPATGFEGTGYYLPGVTGNTAAFWTNGSSGFTAQLASVQ
jgi:hypothetical protein